MKTLSVLSMFALMTSAETIILNQVGNIDGKEL